MEVTFENFIKALKKNMFVIGNCSICNAPLYFIGHINRDDIYGLDTNCDCVRYVTDIKMQTGKDFEFYLNPENGWIGKISEFINKNA